MTQYLAFDIGGTNLKYGLLDHSGHLLEKGQTPTVTENLPAFMASLTQLVDHYQGQFDGIAISAPGKVDVSRKIIHFGGALPFLDGANLQQALGDRYQVPIGLENDGKAAALAELWLGQLKGIQQGAAVVLGTGVGGGLIINGQLLHGEHFQAGELSFIDDDFSQPEEAGFVGSNGSAVQMIMAVNQALAHLPLKDGHAAFAAIQAGVPEAVRLFNAYCDRLAVLILNIQAVVDLQRIVIGGGISAQPVTVSTIIDCYRLLEQTHPNVAQTLTRPEIVRAKFGNDANLYGALYALLLELNGEA